MRALNWCKKIAILPILLLIGFNAHAGEEHFIKARTLQRNGEYDKAIEAYKEYLIKPIAQSEFNEKELFYYTEALVQLMNTYQSKGEPEACVATLKELFKSTPTLQHECLRDYYSVLGYALSRTENMEEAEQTTLKVFILPLYNATPERYFRDYAYAAAVFYSNPDYQNEVISWCEEALRQAELSENKSGAQWVRAMLGSLYKKNGHLNSALKLLNKSKKEAELKGDALGVLNSLNSLIDLLLYWDIPEYANRYASEAIRVERSITAKNPMISAQTYINKGRTLHQLGERDSVAHYTDIARKFCEELPYNSGMVDVNLLHGSVLTERGGDSLHLGILELEKVAEQGTITNRAKAYHHLAQSYLRQQKADLAEPMLDSLRHLLSEEGTNIYIGIDYEPILNHYIGQGNQANVEHYTKLMLREQDIFKQKSLNFNLVESIVELQTEQQAQETKIEQLKLTNHHLWLLIGLTIVLIVSSAIVILLLVQRRRLVIQVKRADERLASLVQELNQSKDEKEEVTNEIKELLQHHENRKELETLTPHILKDGGETKFRQCFELLHPLFLHRLRERVPSITRREELLSMLIVLKQDNRDIAELLAIAPRSVLMLRHRFRQKIGMATEVSLEQFIDEALNN